MIVSSINGTTTPVFKARMSTRQGVMKSFMTRNADEESVSLVNKVADAFEKHPSNAFIRIDEFKGAGFYGARGVIKSRHAIYTDVEPTPYDGVSSVQNIIRRILNPENKDCFNKLMGNKHNDVYDSWWAENISPIWSDVNKKFRTKTFFEGNYDKEFNQDFQNREEKTWKKLFVNR